MSGVFTFPGGGGRSSSRLRSVLVAAVRARSFSTCSAAFRGDNSRARARHCPRASVGGTRGRADFRRSLLPCCADEG